MLRGTADMYVGMSALHRERERPGCRQRSYLSRSEELGEHTGLPQNRYRWRVAMARIREAEGDLDGALDLLDEAEHAYVGDFSPERAPGPGGEGAGLDPARADWVTRSAGPASEGLSVEDELSYLREYEHVTLARALLARDARASAPSTRWTRSTVPATRLLRAAEEGDRTGSVIEILVLQALAASDARRHRRPPGAA